MDINASSIGWLRQEAISGSKKTVYEEAVSQMPASWRSSSIYAVLGLLPAAAVVVAAAVVAAAAIMVLVLVPLVCIGPIFGSAGKPPARMKSDRNRNDSSGSSQEQKQQHQQQHHHSQQQ